MFTIIVTIICIALLGTAIAAGLCAAAGSADRQFESLQRETRHCPACDLVCRREEEYCPRCNLEFEF